MKHNSGFVALVSDAKGRIQEITADEVKRWLENGEAFYFIDTREESEFAQGALPNAIHLSKGVIEVKIEKVIPDVEANIVVYCGGGSRSALVADNLQKMGYTQVRSLQGGYRGFNGWAFSDFL